MGFLGAPTRRGPNGVAGALPLPGATVRGHKALAIGGVLAATGDC